MDERTPNLLPPPEDDPLFMTDDEREQLLRLQDQMSGDQALRRVLRTSDRYKRFRVAEARLDMDQIAIEARTANQARADAIAREKTDSVIEVLRDTATDSAGEHSDEPATDDDILGQSARAAKQIMKQGLGHPPGEPPNPES